MDWTTIGKDAHMAKAPTGFVHVMKFAAQTWSVTLNGRIIGTATNAEDGKRLAEDKVAA